MTVTLYTMPYYVPYVSKPEDFLVVRMRDGKTGYANISDLPVDFLKKFVVQ